MKKAVFAGSFDPVTLGHWDIVHRALPLFDKIIVAMGINSSKSYFFDTEQRLALLRATFEEYGDKIEIDTYQELTAFYCRRHEANFILRGLRNGTDFDYENTIANLNNTIDNNLETIFLISSPQFSFYSSTVVREIIKGKGNAQPFLRPKAWELMQQWSK